MTSPVEAFYSNQSGLYSYCLDAKEVTYAQDVEQLLRKNLPLAAASHFEHEITEMLLGFARSKSQNCQELVSFVENKALKRQFHTLFNWDQGTNINSFLSLFGKEFKAAVETEIKANAELDEGARAFLEIGAIRNRIVHQNYATFASDKSADEIYKLYQKAEKIVAFLKQKLA